jgi:hypothetical protein
LWHYSLGWWAQRHKSFEVTLGKYTVVDKQVVDKQVDWLGFSKIILFIS